MKYIQKLTAAVTALGFCLASLFVYQSSTVPVQADDGQKVVIIGDSISTGAGLAEGEKSYVDWLAYYTDVQIQNFAQDNYTTAEVLQCLDNAQIQAALSEADMILVTVGIHDIMDPFLEVANSYMTKFGFEKFTDVFTANLADYGIESEDDLIPYSNNLGRAVRSNQDTAAENMLAITDKLSQYQNAKIIYQTVYNSTDTIENLSSLSRKRQNAYTTVCNPITSVVNECFNNHLYELEEQGSCLVVDTFAGFKSYAYQYTNLNDLDANPNAAGHIWIADAIIEKAGLEKTEPTEPTTEETTTTESTSTSTTTTTESTSTSTSTTTTTESTSTSTSTTTTTEPTSTSTSTTTTTESTSTSTSTTTTTESTSTSTSTTTTTESTSTSTSTTTTTESTSTSTSTTTTTRSTSTSTSTTTTTESTSTLTSTTTTAETTSPSTTETTVFGDMNGDDDITAADASILLVAAANIGAGQPSGLTEEQETRFDFNHDGEFTSADSALMLVYAAGKGTGEISIEFDEYVQMQ